MTYRKILIALITAAAVAGLASCGGGSDNANSATYTVGGTVNGSVGAVELQLNGANGVSQASPGAFTFGSGLASGAAYSVTANGAQNCNVTNGTGTMGVSNITDVVITCTSVIRSATLSGTQENPPNPSAATGRGAVIVDPTTREITGGISFAGLTPSSGGHHIHQAPAGNPAGNGPVIIGLLLTADGQTATVPAATVLTADQYTALVAGELYFNVHTTTYPTGEIRGQINQRDDVTAGIAGLTGGAEVPSNSSAARGRGTIVFDSTTGEVITAYVTHDVSATTVAHIHTGAPGANGPANVISLTAQGADTFTSPPATILTPQNIIDINNGNTYFNVHSTGLPAGEIRGQVAVQ